jgi:hypothetical protein
LYCICTCLTLCIIFVTFLSVLTSSISEGSLLLWIKWNKISWNWKLKSSQLKHFSSAVYNYSTAYLWELWDILPCYFEVSVKK